MQFQKRDSQKVDSYLILPEMEPTAGENDSLLGTENPRCFSAVENIALSLRPLHKRSSVDGTSNGVNDDRALRSALLAARRWKSTTKRATNVRRLRDVIDEVLERHNPGAAPGIDLRRSKYQHLATKWCLPAKITVVDYDAKDIAIHSNLEGAEQLSTFLGAPHNKARVRWIHVDGLNWEVVQVLALKFDLHPLALEDTVHVPQRIKADFYDSCLYVSLLYLYLARDDGSGDPNQGNDNLAAGGAIGGAAAASSAVQATRHPRTASQLLEPSASASASSSEFLLPRTISRVTGGDAEAAPTTAAVTSRAASRAASAAPALEPRRVDLEDGGGFLERRESQLITPGPSHWPQPLRHGFVNLAALPTRGHGRRGRGRGSSSAGPESPGGGGASAVSVHVSAQQVSLFLLRGENPNTLITIFQSDGSEVTQPILEQLREARTLVREAEDASFLANIVIDTLVDNIFPVVSAYREQLQQYEVDVTGSGPDAAASTRELHAMQRDLRRIDRTIAPLQAVVANMVSRDATPVLGLGTASTSSAAISAEVTGVDGAQLGPTTPANPAPRPPPFLSRLTCTYLNDVRDHVATICEDLLSLSMECGDLIGLIFNLTTLQQSQSTQTLAVVSTIFLPITFLAGVYGMNFDTLPELHWSYGYLYFWITSILIVVVFMAVMQRARLWSWSGLTL